MYKPLAHNTILRGFNIISTKAMAVLALDEFPVEILFNILSLIPDIPELGCLMHASPAVYRILENHVYLHQLIANICATGYTCGHIWVIFRICALVRASRLPQRTLAEFHEYVIREALRANFRIRHSKYGFAPETLDPFISTAIVKSLLATATQAAVLASDCLEFYLSKFRELHPRKLVKEKSVGEGLNDLWILGYESTELPVVDAGPFSWTEQQRAIRAVWRVQLLSDVKAAVHAGLLGWSAQDVAALEARPTITPPPSGQYLRAVREEQFGKQARTSTESFYGGRYNYEEQTHPDGRLTYGTSLTPLLYELYDEFWTVIRTPPEYEPIHSLIAYIKVKYGTSAADEMQQGHIDRNVYRSGSYFIGVRPEPQAWRRLVNAGPGAQVMTCGMPDADTRDFSVRMLIPFDIFAPHGFAYWSEERLRGYGLVERRQKSRRPPFCNQSRDCNFAWYSLLNQHERAAVNERAWQELKKLGYTANS